MAYNTVMSRLRKHHWALAVVLLFAAIVPLSAASRPKCSYCGKSIIGKYTKYKGEHRLLNICKQCHRTLPRCGLCQIPIRKPSGWDGRKELFCPTCLKKRIVCVVCRKTIKGKHLKSANTNEAYCQKCNAAAVKCASCRKPLKKAEQTTVHGKRICDYCNEKSPKCDRCGFPIVGSRISYRFADGLFCSHCNDNCLHCYVCAVPLGEERLKLSDNRFMCPECGKSAVLTMAALRMIHNRSVGFLRRNLDMDVQNDYELKLARRRNQLGIEGKEIHGKEQGLFTTTGGQPRILILEGATEAMCYETVAHFDFQRALERLQARTDQDYGTGYQKFAAVEKEKGVKGVFEFLAEKSQK